MKLQYVKIRSLLVVFTISTMALHLTSCSSVKEISSSPFVTESGESHIKCTRYNSDSNIRYGVAQYNDEVLVRMELTDKAAQTMYLTGGTRVYFDATAKKKREMYVALPTRSIKDKEKVEPKANKQSKTIPLNKPDEMQPRNAAMLLKANDATVFHINEQDYRINEGYDTLDVSSTLVMEGSKLVHSISISTKYFDANKLSIGIVGSKGAMDAAGGASEKGGQPGGMGRGPGGSGGGPGGMGGGPGGGRGGMGGGPGGEMGQRPNAATMSQLKAPKIWFKYFLNN